MLNNVIAILLNGKKALVEASIAAFSAVSTVTDRALIEANKRHSYVSKRFSPSSQNCARWMAAQRLSNYLYKKEDFSANQLRLFAVGTLVHEWYQNTALGNTGKLYGIWECPSCGTLLEWTTKPSSPCQGSITSSITGETKTCAQVIEDRRLTFNWHYKEIYIRFSPDDCNGFEAGTKSDGIYLAENGWYVLEIKSADPNIISGEYQVKSTEEIYKAHIKQGSVRIPLENHVRQAQITAALILDAMDKETIPPIDAPFLGVAIIYINRENLQEKVIPLPYDSSYYTTMVNRMKESGEAVAQRDYMKASAACSSRSSVYAKRCPLQDECFPLKRKINKAVDSTASKTK